MCLMHIGDTSSDVYTSFDSSISYAMNFTAMDHPRQTTSGKPHAHMHMIMVNLYSYLFKKKSFS